MAKLDGKRALITGAAAGIGRAIALKLAREGAVVALTDVQEPTLSRTLGELKELSPQSLACKMDVTRQGEIDEAVQKVLETFGGLDILVNNAGVSSMARFTDLTEQEWDLNLDVNTKGVWRVTKTVAPIFMGKRRGKIVMIASMAGKLGAPLLAHYSASKFAVIGFMQAVARELAEYNINVNAVCPGFVQTSMQDREIVWEAKLRGIDSPQKVREEYISMTPLRRLCTPEDVADVVFFLASEESGFMTGQALNVTGGVCVH